MKEIPILFNGEMVRAILDGTKTQTRRPVKFQTEYDKVRLFDGRHFPKYLQGNKWVIDALGNPRKSPFGKPGDVLIPAMEIKGYDNKYAADVFGSIWSKASGEWKKLKSNATSNYLRLTLRLNKKDVNRTVHKLVCTAWYGNAPFKKAVVRHIDGNSLNNAPENLDWGTYSDNWSDRKYHGRGIHSEHQISKLSMEIAHKIRVAHDVGVSISDLARQYQVNHKTVSRVISGETWVEYTDQLPRNMPKAACRIKLKVKRVWVERVQDITNDDAIAEGLCAVTKDGKLTKYGIGDVDGLPFGKGWPWREFTSNPVSAFKKIWNSIYGTWDDNPWVWCCEFQRLEDV
jgi:hypothetical protein